MLTALTSIIGKEFRQTFRDRRMIALLSIAPVMQLLVLGFAVNLEVEHVPAVVADEDLTPESRDFAAGLLAGDAVDAAGHVPNGAAATEMVARGEVPIALIIPRGFGDRVREERSAEVQVLVDGGDSNRAIVAQNAVAAYALGRSLELARDRLERLARATGRQPSVASVRVEPRVFYNPTLDSQIFFVPGVASTLLIVVTTVVTAMGLARENEMGTLEQVMVTPIGPTTLVLGKTIPYALLGLVDLGLVVAVGALVFDVPLRGELWILFLAGLLYLLTTLGIGILISALAKQQQQALAGAFFFFMPAILLSGFITPIDNMPAWLQPLTSLNPARHFIEVMRAVLLKAATFEELRPQLVALAGTGFSIFGLSALVLRRKLA